MKAPKPIARHILISAQPVAPTSSDASTLKSEPRESYPMDVLTHRFMPYGSQDPIEGDEVVSMDVDAVEVGKIKSPENTERSPKKESTPAATKKTKGKKRKGEGDAETPTAKKVKKAKTSS